MPMDSRSAERLEQRRYAIARANQVRHRRARLKRMLQGGDVHLAEVLREPPPYLRTMLLEQLLEAAPHLGKRKSERIVKSAQVRRQVQIGELTEREREAVLATMRVEFPRMWKGWQQAVEAAA
jgi:hypothetical protein